MLCSWFSNLIAVHVSRWGQVFILDALSRYKAADAREAENIVERVTPRLQHANCAVVLSAVKVTISLFNAPHYIVIAIALSLHHCEHSHHLFYLFSYHFTCRWSSNKWNLSPVPMSSEIFAKRWLLHSWHYSLLSLRYNMLHWETSTL